LRVLCKGPRTKDEFVGNFKSFEASKEMSSLSGHQHEPAAAAAEVAPADSRDAAWLRQAQAGDRGAYAQVVIAHQDRLYNAVLRMVGDTDEAAELTQEAFTRGLEKIDSFRGDASAYTWLFRIAMNLAISRLRKVQRKRVFSLNAPASGGRRREATEDQASALMDRLAGDRAASPAEQAERRERDEQVVAALGRLDAEHRAVLVMRDVEGFDYQQMADVLGLPLGTLKSRLFRARLALRDELRAYLSERR
jgi:RNA polymerase sigma-70 factor (ECF subfamily)